MARRDPNTLDLYMDYEPEAVVDRFDAADTQAWTRAGKLSKAVALALSNAPISREEVAAAMTQFMGGERVSKQLLDKYASQAAEEHSISALRLAALIAVTGDVRPLNTLLEELNLIVVPRKYEALLKREQARIAKEKFERAELAADAEWRARR